MTENVSRVVHFPHGKIQLRDVYYFVSINPNLDKLCRKAPVMVAKAFCKPLPFLFCFKTLWPFVDNSHHHQHLHYVRCCCVPPSCSSEIGNIVFFFPATSLYSVRVSHLQDCEFLENRVVLGKDENTRTSSRQATILKRKKGVCVCVLLCYNQPVVRIYKF